MTPYLRQRLEALTTIEQRPLVVMRQTTGELTSTANARGLSRQAMQAKASGTKAKRAMGAMFGREMVASVATRPAFSVVLLTRIAPRMLDSDNLEGAFKAVRDGIAEALGIDDRSPLVRYVVSQEQGAPREHLVRAELYLEPRTGEEPFDASDYERPARSERTGRAEYGVPTPNTRIPR